MVVERRDIVRLDVAWKATVTRLNGEQLPGSSDNVSMSGINIILDKELVIGEPVELNLVAKSGGGINYFSLQGVVVYVRNMPDNTSLSIGFRLLVEDPLFQEYFI